jgi:hypothetical protein
MDPIAILTNGCEMGVALKSVCDMALVIPQTITVVRANHEQCKRLGERIDAIYSVLNSMNDRDFQKPELQKSLSNFCNCVKQCLEFITSFKDEASWCGKIFSNQNYKVQFEELNLQLSQCAADLNLGINLKQLFDHKQDENDQQKDLNDIQSKLDEIASLMVQQQNEQLRHHEGCEEHIKEHINERLNSFKHHLEQSIIKASDPVKVQKIATEEHAFRHIPYYDLMLEKCIGNGGFADVFRGKWVSQDEQVAIKVIRIQHLRERAREDFIKEISTMHRIRYTHILNIFGACMEPEKYALIVEYMTLGSLYDVLREHALQLTWPDRWSIARQMTKGINHLHTLPIPIIHRDIKSLNILMTERGQEFLVKVADFGLAKIRHETSRESSHGPPVGTLPWKAPELLKMGKHTEASDVYAMGVVFWELATGCEPYEEADESVISAFVLRGDRLEIPTNIPDSFAELISRAWTPEPNKRATCQQLLGLMKENCLEPDAPRKSKVRKNYACLSLSSTLITFYDGFDKNSLEI